MNFIQCRRLRFPAISRFRIMCQREKGTDMNIERKKFLIEIHDVVVVVVKKSHFKSININKSRQLCVLHISRRNRTSLHHVKRIYLCIICTENPTYMWFRLRVHDKHFVIARSERVSNRKININRRGSVRSHQLNANTMYQTQTHTDTLHRVTTYFKWWRATAM